MNVSIITVWGYTEILPVLLLALDQGDGNTTDFSQRFD